MEQLFVDREVFVEVSTDEGKTVRRETLREVLRRTERETVISALQRHDGYGRMGVVAKELGISRKSLWERMRRLNIDKKTARAQKELL